MSEIDKKYDWKSVEDNIYDAWEKSGYFSPDNLETDGEPYSIVLPPPNVTGTLHMGHAMYTVQDILIRYKRLKGFKTLWLPGTDHAATATSEKVEKLIYKKEKKNRHDLGREEFLKRVEDFAKQSHDTIVNQLKKMGFSLDWSREAYTLDKARQNAVTEAFKRMYEAGLIYRGKRIVNWDPGQKTTISDDEVVWKDQQSDFYYIKYGPFTIGTARPETKFGDKYVVMHPDDKRYKEYKHGQEIEVDWINKEGKITATIIKDEAADPEFGTGVMTITPWHDGTDFEIAKRHDLDMEQIIDLDGKLLDIAGDFAGMHIKKARPLIVKRLKERGLLEKVDEKYENRIATAERGGEIIEPQVMEQWFIDVNKEFEFKKEDWLGKSQVSIEGGSKISLKGLMRHVVEKGDIKITPKRFEKNYYHWIDNLRDWCISRQLWYGHRIPVWSKDGKMEVGEKPEGDGWEQDPDTLDTWFSSGLWAFSTLGWPSVTEDLKTYHPTDVLETGYDIIFFWVARMILMSGFLLGDIPFKDVYLHGLVRAEDGTKMSKSKGNIVDPLDMKEKYGADAVRMSLIVANTPGNDMNLSEEKIKAYRNFTTKIWNASRFIMMNWDDSLDIWGAKLSKDDEKVLKEFEKLKKKVEKNIEGFQLHLAAEELYHYFWHTFADKLIEEKKEAIQSEDNETKASGLKFLATLLREQLILLHPFMPFVTEELYQKLPFADKKEFLMIENWG